MKKILFLFFILNTVFAQTELVLNGDFSQNNYAWGTTTYFSYNSYYSNCLSCPGYAHADNGYGQPKSYLRDYLTQNIQIPANTTSLNLSFYSSATLNGSSTGQERIFIYVYDYNLGVTNIVATIYYYSSSYYQFFSYSIPTWMAGHSVELGFRAESSYTPTTFRIDNVSLISIEPQNCVTWVNGEPESLVKEATEFLCENELIDPIQNYQTVFNLPLKDICKTLTNSLFDKNTALPSDNFPSPFSDLDGLSYEDLRAVKAMLYFENNDGYSPLSRNFFMLYPNFSPRFEIIVRLVLEARGITPDWTGYNPNSNASSNFCCDIKVNNLYYGWFKKANDLGLLNDFYGNCYSCPSVRCFQNYYQFPWKSFYILLYRVLSNPNIPNPPIDNNAFYVPNNFTVANSGSEMDIKRAVFNEYSKSSFSIPSGGLTLEFSHSYNSLIAEFPTYNFPYSTNEFTESPEVYKNTNYALYPIGIGWSHNYNSSILRVIKFNRNTGIGEVNKLYIKWADGKTHVYDYLTRKYETKGVYDKLEILQYNQDNSPSLLTITKPNQIKYTFDVNSDILKLIKISDRNNNTLDLTYEDRVCFQNQSCFYSQYRLKTVTESTTNRQLNFSYYPGTDFISSVSDGVRQIFFNVNPNTLNLDSFIDAKSQTTQYSYCNQDNCKNLLTTITLPKGNVINNTYFKRKLKQTKTDAYTIDVDFNTSFSSSSISTNTDIKLTQNGQQFTTNFSHDQFGNLSKVTSPSENLSISYNDLQNPTLPTLVVDNKTNVTLTFSYDANGNQIFSKKSAPNLPDISSTTFFNQFNDPISNTDPNGGTTLFDYNSTGNLTSTTDPMGGKTLIEVNSHGLPISTTNPSGIKKFFEYNNIFGNLTDIRVLINGVKTTLFQATYDNLSREIYIKNGLGIYSQFAYDNNDNLISYIQDPYITNPNGLNLSNFYNIDQNDNIIGIQNAMGYVTTLTYNNSDDLVKEQFNDDFKEWEYNTDGSLKSHKNKNGVVFNHEYFGIGDSREGLLKSDGINQYDYYLESKNLKTVTQNTKVLTFYHDGYNRTEKVNYNDFPNNSVGYKYDKNGNITRVIYNESGTIYFDYEYDLNNRLIRIKDWQNRTIVQYFYLPDGRLDYQINGNNTKHLLFYDTSGRLDSMSIRKSNNSPIGYFANKLDVQGHIINESSYIIENPEYPIFQNEEVISVPDASNRKRRVGDKVNNYDKQGNQISNGSTNQTFDLSDRLTNVQYPNKSFLFEYDPLKNRRRKNNTRYVVDVLNNGNVLMETDLNGNPSALYVHGNGLVARLDIQTNKYSYYHFDFRGSTSVITDETGMNVTHKYLYGPYGESAQKTELFEQPFQYIGKYGVMTDTTDLYFMRERYYNPNEGEFKSEDPVWNINLYPYADGDPINNIDPFGNSSIPYSPSELGLILLLSPNKTSYDPVFEADQYNAEEKNSYISMVSGFIVPELGGEFKALNNIRNKELAGGLHPKTKVPFNKKAYPDFTNYLYKNGKNDVKIVPTGSRKSDAMAANKIAGYQTTPKNYTWHHHQNKGRMQLVKKKIHLLTGHTGGFSIWK